MSSHDPMAVALTEVRDILRSYRREKQAEAIARPIHLRTSDAPPSSR